MKLNYLILKYLLLFFLVFNNAMADSLFSSSNNSIFLKAEEAFKVSVGNQSNNVSNNVANRPRSLAMRTNAKLTNIFFRFFPNQLTVKKDGQSHFPFSFPFQLRTFWRCNRLMLEPLSRNAREGITTPGGNMWFSQ